MVLEQPSRPTDDSQEIALRVSIFKYLIFIIFLLLGARFWFLQVIDHKKYLQEAENNRIRDLPLPAPRGNILDREGRILVDSRPSFSIVVDREEMRNREETLKAISENLGVSREFVLEQFENITPRSLPVTIKLNATAADRAWVEAHQYEHPELRVQEVPQRKYPYGEWMAHALGYVGQISKRQLELPGYRENYKMGDIIGQDGLEKTYNLMLMGKEGSRRVIVDSLGRIKGEVGVIAPTPGMDLYTTIDLDLQRVAEEQMAGKKGVVIAMDPRNGEILAMVSRQSFDPNLFSQRITTPEGKAEYRELMADPKHSPLYNKAIRGTFPTGSTWKILISTMALELGAITPEKSRIVCGGGIATGNRFVRCMKNHGAPDIHTAIAQSCDGYFYRLGLKLGVDTINEWVSKMGMGRKTGIDLPHEERGIIPSREYKARVNKIDPRWKDFDTVLASVGQGTVAVPPLQLLRAISGIAMGGEFYTPHLFKELRDRNNKPIKFYEDRGSFKLPISKVTHSVVTFGMWGAANEPGGTAYVRGRLDGFDIAGKTGTAQVIAMEKARGEEHKDHGWFVSFAPWKSPEIAVVVLVENAGFGGVVAAPVARAVYVEYFSKKLGYPVDKQQVAANTNPLKQNAVSSRQ